MVILVSRGSPKDNTPHVNGSYLLTILDNIRRVTLLAGLDKTDLTCVQIHISFIFFTHDQSHPEEPEIAKINRELQ